MKYQPIRLLLALVLLLPTWAPTATAASNSQTFKGEYVWEQSANGNLEAVFTPTGPGQWNVAFHFTFNGKSHVFAGTAQGSLTQGELQGRVRTDNQSRTFTFHGRFEGGTFRGTHSEEEDGEEYETGTLTLRR